MYMYRYEELLNNVYQYKLLTNRLCRVCLRPNMHAFDFVSPRAMR